MARLYLILFSMILSGAIRGQEIFYSDTEPKNLHRSTFFVIGRFGNKILVYRTIYVEPVRNPPAGIPTNWGFAGIPQKTINIFDTSMHLLSTNRPLFPGEISGVHFLARDDFFYMFYRYQEATRIFCMAAKIDLDGKMTGAPVELDHMEVTPGTFFQNRTWSFLFSDDKKKVLAFHLHGYTPTGHVLRSLLFDEKLQIIRSSSDTVVMPGAKFLTEFKLDNEGNFIFLGSDGPATTDHEKNRAIFTRGAEGDSLFVHYLLSPGVFADDPRLLIDNDHGRYILLSFFSKTPKGNIDGLWCVIRDAREHRDLTNTRTLLPDELRRQIDNGNFKKALNDVYLQGLHLRHDGGFDADAQQLSMSDYGQLYDRWDYHSYFSGRVSLNLLYYDPFYDDYFYPWVRWEYKSGSYSFKSQRTLVFSFTPEGLMDWANPLNTPQDNLRSFNIGYKSFVKDDLIYFLYNVTIRRKNYLTAQSINSSGQINTDPRLKEDRELTGVKRDIIYNTRYARIVGPGEIIVPCHDDRSFWLARIKF